MPHQRRYRQQRQRFPRLARRAEKMARLEVHPQRQQAQREIGRIQRQAGGAARSARRTTSRQADYERGLSDTLRNVATPGLAQRQMAQGARQVERYGQGLASLAQRGGRQDIRGVRQQTPSVQDVAAQSLAGAVFEREEAQRARKASLQRANREARHLISLIPERELGSLHSRLTREELAKDIASTEGIDIGPEGARALVQRLYDRIRGQLPPPVLSDAERAQQSPRTPELREQYRSVNPAIDRRAAGPFRPR